MSASLKFRSESEIAEREKHKAAVHEASHVVILRHFGGYGRPSIWPNIERQEDESAWRGQCQIFAMPDQPDNCNRLVGMAGFVGEMMDYGETDSNSIWNALFDATVDEEISKTDAAMIGEDWTMDDVEEVMRLLSKLWHEVEREVKCMKAYYEDQGDNDEDAK